ncbi:MAG: pentapeptide repeat-containing protein [Chloroflexota bacterium]
MSTISSDTEYIDQTFKGVQLGGIELRGSDFDSCHFSDCNFADATWRDCQFTNCVFQQCDLSLVQVPATSFLATRFESCKLIGVDWTRADWNPIRRDSPISFLSCTLNHSTFIGLNLCRLQLTESMAANVDFREANLSRASFANTDLLDSLFLNTNMTGADLSQARQYTIAPQHNNLKQTKFSLPEAMSLLYNLDIVLVEE